ncbi:MAG TPA: LPS export ABC transporter ATP-binding protein [Aquifex aeolicus]|uniref:Lipopolysaccharide export system ATP-binding protein LptB n=1 Tax=Aquifex aeolicus TaxID=63363 RepID=A0A9D1CF93_AQUAO|nr:LPS export ABC transporter ATP-binding protein [Aquificales bacterium]HIP86154.1 LPS export ABC transporter ATP-binding protein [Aquifex sp.]HIP98186.1 LPS export ABC transporter ATP-binding protein [Aquifex aeolicus]HIQ26593.1 LPS export ABC transporter ATP-binding protein [Aquifex aeolicus]
MLEAKNLRKFIKGKEILKGISLKVERGQTVGLLGANGAGKTTTFRCLIGFEKPDEGKIFLNGEDITDLPPYKRAEKGLAFLPQEHSLFYDLTVFENIFMFAELLYGREKAEELTEELLRDFHLYQLKDRKAGVLSGGEKRRLEIARIFLKTPQYLLLDEPFAGVDPLHVEEISQLIKRIQTYAFNHPIGIIITDHKAEKVFKLADWIYVLDEGRLLAEGPPQEVAQHPDVRNRYLGKDFKY